MNAKSLVIISIFGIAPPALAAVPTIDQLIANPSLLNAEMDRCKHLGMAANDDARCQAAWQAENKRFFGNGPGTYTPAPVTVFNNTPKFDPQPNSQKPHPSTSSGPPNGQ
jgi:conjugative transfer region protein TrbK